MKFNSRFLALILSLTLILSNGCGYNDIQGADEQTKSSWSEVLNQYQRRADLVPNLVSTVKGYASHEQEVLIAVTEARSHAAEMKVTPELLNDPASMEKFQQAQTALSSSLGRLLAVSENYPQLKADAAFRDLQAQLEGTENRITIARGNFISAIQRYNTMIRSFPNNLTAKWFGYQSKAQLQVENEKAIAVPPVVDFNK